MADDTRLKARVVSFYPGERDFGFIRPEGWEGNLFMHVNDLAASGIFDLSKIKPGVILTCEVGTNTATGKKFAKNVKLEESLAA